MSNSLQISAIIHSAKVDRDGQWHITLEVPQQDGTKIAALATQTQQVFKVSFEAE